LEIVAIFVLYVCLLRCQSLEMQLVCLADSNADRLSSAHVAQRLPLRPADAIYGVRKKENKIMHMRSLFLDFSRLCTNTDYVYLIFSC